MDSLESLTTPWVGKPSNAGNLSGPIILRHRINVMPICIQENKKSAPSTNRRLSCAYELYQSQQGAIFLGKLGISGLFSTFLSNARTGS